MDRGRAASQGTSHERSRSISSDRGNSAHPEPFSLTGLHLRSRIMATLDGTLPDPDDHSPHLTKRPGIGEDEEYDKYYTLPVLSFTWQSTNPALKVHLASPSFIFLPPSFFFMLQGSGRP